MPIYWEDTGRTHIVSLSDWQIPYEHVPRLVYTWTYQKLFSSLREC